MKSLTENLFCVPSQQAAIRGRAVAIGHWVLILCAGAMLIDNLREGWTLLAGVDVVFAVLVAVNLLMLRSLRRPAVSAGVLLTLCGAALIFSIIKAGPGAGLLLPVAFPTACMFLLGRKAGLAAAGIFLAAVTAVLWLPWLAHTGWIASDAARFRFLAVYALVTALSFANEIVKGHALKQAADAGAFLQQVIDHVPAGLFLKDTTGTFVGCNKAFSARMVGLPSEKIIGKTVYDICAHDLAELHHGHDREVLACGQPRSYEGRHGPVGSSPLVMVHKAPLYDERMNPRGIVGVAVDLTERTKAEEDLRKALTAAESASRARSEFLSAVSHEVRTPMTTIAAMAEMLGAQCRSPELKEPLEVLAGASNRLMDLLRNVLDAARIESGEIVLHEESFEVRAMVDETIRTYSSIAASKSLLLTSELPDGLPPAVNGDPERVRQVLGNLVDNAVKFTDSGFVRLVVTVLQQAPARVLLRFSVQDSGAGLTPQLRETLGGACHGSDTSLAGRPGPGLGLAIVNYLTNVMGGAITVDSKEGVGTTIHVDLPFGVSV